ncbi:hypothetical protein JOD43_003700 [Pullulanibacillus pueri]|uniref:Glycosyl hydrolase family 115 n=1 Tax=Pullulanibacillus pueri TaxID=1437324 RepID=A0A8J2ZZ10_9BACL|nr:glycosyl hydrolase 115 family protein [Pullulanibacillus pueri]MBM7683520.1 hypothetical protein [Pullulanibacillus pueri]GGH86931.1 hypothetical protein GCM10007096_35780 [Pullulanibacillus pueri]
MSKDAFVLIDQNTIIRPPESISSPVQHALNMIRRDHEKVFGKIPELTNSPSAAPDLIVRYALPEDRCPNWPETFCFRFHLINGKWTMHIIGQDDLGIIYGLLYYSQHYLGVDPFWFWADLPISTKVRVEIPTTDYNSEKFKVKYRGWFVNDEVCLIGWKEDYPPSKEIWYPVFEALLRCGGNMVIPGTDLPKEGIHAKLASEMGLWVTHHHAEPLGAEMFLRAYPGKNPNYMEHPELFEQLWREAILKQKDQKVIWVLSFRGQGDAPFWLNTPEFDTPQKRGEMISKVVEKQYQMVCESIENPVCCMALYGEISELYKQGYISVPDGVIKIWADNGYGKMVSRRRENENLRIPSLPAYGDPGEHGIYYHVTFHDLQASNHLTMFPSPLELVKGEIEQAFETGAHSYLLLNSGNIRMHLYPLDLVSHLWRTGEVQIIPHLEAFVQRLYSSYHKRIEHVYRDYSNHTISYGPHPDDQAGEQFYHHPARHIIGHWLQGKCHLPVRSLFWATGEVPFNDQINWFKAKCEEALLGWMDLLEECCDLFIHLGDEDQRRFYDQLMMQVELHASGCRGMIALCDAYYSFAKQNYAVAFVQVSQSIRSYNESLLALRKAEQYKWKHFYRADWLTNIKSTLYSLESLRKYIRMQEDSPDFFLWYKKYLMSETEKYIYLENTHRKPLSDDDLAQQLEELFRKHLG